MRSVRLSRLASRALVAAPRASTPCKGGLLSGVAQGHGLQGVVGSNRAVPTIDLATSEELGAPSAMGEFSGERKRGRGNEGLGGAIAGSDQASGYRCRTARPRR